MTPSAFRQLVAARRRAIAVNVPGFEALFIRPLSDLEVSRARLAAQKHLEAECREAGLQLRGAVDLDPELLDRERTVQVVFRAYVTPAKDPDDEPDTAFESVGWVRALDTVLVQALFDAYVAALEQRAVTEPVNAEALDSLVTTIRAGGEGALLFIAPLDLRRIIVALTARLPT